MSNDAKEDFQFIEFSKNLVKNTSDSVNVSGFNIDKDRALQLVFFLMEKIEIRAMYFLNTRCSLEALEVFLEFFSKRKDIILVKFTAIRFDVSQLRKVAEIEEVVRDNYNSHKRLTNAAFNGFYKVVEKFLTSGVHQDGVHYSENFCATPLHMALSRGHVNVGKLLLSKNIKPNGNQSYLLDLSRNRIPTAYIGSLADLMKDEELMKNITVVDLSYNDLAVGSSVEKLIEGLTCISTLSVLYLRSCCISMDGAIALGKLFESLHFLKEVRLESNFIRDIGFEKLVEARKSQSICSPILYLDLNYISPRKFLAFEKDIFFVNSPLLRQGRKSVIDEKKIITREEWLIIIARKSVRLTQNTDVQHAFIFFEGMNEYGQLFLQRCDFRPVGSKVCDYKFVPIKFGMKGEVNISSLDPGRLQREIANFTYLSIEVDCERALKIQESIALDKKEPPFYQTPGSRILSGYNCFTWCLAKIQDGGIDTTDIFNNFLLAQTSDYIPAKQDDTSKNAYTQNCAMM